MSRIQLQSYSFSDCELLSVQTDGSINPGNSGGPVLNAQNLVVGIAFQASSSDHTDTVGEFIPNVVFERCILKSKACNGEVISVPGLGFSFQKLESRTMRAFLGLNDLAEPNNSGVYVTEVAKFGAVAAVLREGDVVTEVEGSDGKMVSIGNQGTFPFRSIRVGFSHLFSTRVVGDRIKLGVVRGGKYINVEFELAPAASTLLVPEHDKMNARGSDTPEYIIIGGLVFIGLNSYSLASEWDDSCPGQCITAMRHKEAFGVKQNEDHEVVVLSQVLDADVNYGFEHFRSAIVESFNGVRVNSVAHLAEMWTKCTEKYIQFKLNDSVVVLNRQEAIESEEVIMGVHNIPKSSNIWNVQCSPNASSLQNQEA